MSRLRRRVYTSSMETATERVTVVEDIPSPSSFIVLTSGVVHCVQFQRSESLSQVRVFLAERNTKKNNTSSSDIKDHQIQLYSAIEMAAPTSTRFLSEWTRNDRPRDGIFADLGRITDEEATGAVISAAAAYLVTASERQLDIWLKLSHAGFIDAVKAKGPAIDRAFQVATSFRLGSITYDWIELQFHKSFAWIETFVEKFE
ncbi:hypothetical protein PROFUN_10957 [Planoprotostelium fungivorum]|uniref:Uncharacterized protein n=1 Tax=Planoprotostelium fungivorum TaxID=1890364 RepID=A0A2P6NBU9_9EUKA|nr:hypothetical protein PROFUN_10957 [Planoprotostelium fungivorum]